MRAMHHVVAVAGAFALAAWGQSASAADVFTLTSTTFKDGGMMPKRISNNMPYSSADSAANCVGDNTSPQLSWSGAPAGTKSFAIFMIDPEVRAGFVTHWVGYGIDAKVTGFAEGEFSKASDKYVGGKSTLGIGTYSGPCTPGGVSPHHYTFLIYATDLDPKELPPGLTRQEVFYKIAPAAPGELAALGTSHAKAVTALVGLYVKPSE